MEEVAGEGDSGGTGGRGRGSRRICGDMSFFIPCGSHV
jgi:hypothetical protein